MFSTTGSKDRVVSVEFNCFPLGGGETDHWRETHLDGKLMWKQQSCDHYWCDKLGTGVAPVCSTWGLLAKWHIHLSALKCTITDKGNLDSADLFAHLVLFPIGKFTLWKSSYRNVRCHISSHCWHNYVVQKAKQCVKTSCKRTCAVEKKFLTCIGKHGQYRHLMTLEILFENVLQLNYRNRHNKLPLRVDCIWITSQTMNQVSEFVELRWSEKGLV